MGPERVIGAPSGIRTRMARRPWPFKDHVSNQFHHRGKIQVDAVIVVGLKLRQLQL